MKFTLNLSEAKTSLDQFLRRAGYHHLLDRQSGKESFVRRLDADFYPRLHLYVTQQENGVAFDLHLDQKKPSYQGQRMHSGEYDGPVVEKEQQRLVSLSQSLQQSQKPRESSWEKKGLLRRLFF